MMLLPDPTWLLAGCRDCWSLLWKGSSAHSVVEWRPQFKSTSSAAAILNTTRGACSLQFHSVWLSQRQGSAAAGHRQGSLCSQWLVVWATGIQKWGHPWKLQMELSSYPQEHTWGTEAASPLGNMCCSVWGHNSFWVVKIWRKHILNRPIYVSVPKWCLLFPGALTFYHGLFYLKLIRRTK